MGFSGATRVAEGEAVWRGIVADSSVVLQGLSKVMSRIE